jgi:hypothetical protein
MEPKGIVRSTNVHLPSKRSRVVVVAGGAIRKGGADEHKHTFERERLGKWAGGQRERGAARPGRAHSVASTALPLRRRQLAVTQPESPPGSQDRLRELFGQKQKTKQASRVLQRERRESKGEASTRKERRVTVLPGSRTNRLTPHRFLAFSSSVDAWSRSLSLSTLSHLRAPSASS